MNDTSEGATTMGTAAALAEGYLGRARALAAGVAAARAPWLAQEFESAAALAVWESALRFDPGRGLEFWTLALWRIRGAILDAARKETGGMGRGRGVRFLGLDRVGELAAPAPANPAAPSGLMERAAARLPRPDREVVLLMYRDGLRQGDVAGRLGLTAKRVSFVHARALGRLRADPEAVALLRGDPVRRAAGDRRAEPARKRAAGEARRDRAAYLAEYRRRPETRVREADRAMRRRRAARMAGVA